MLELSPRFDESGRLIGPGGVLYPKIAWRSDLERKLTIKLRFPARARRIASAWDRWFTAERASDAERAALRSWVIEAAPYLGSAALDHAAELRDRSPALAAFESRESAAVSGFLADVVDPVPRGELAPREGPRQVAVFFGELGGGTGSVAQAVIELLRETDDLEPVPLNANADLLGEADPFYCAFGTSQAELWNRFVLDLGDLGAMERFRAARAAIQDHFVPRAVEAAARLAAEHRADRLISVLQGFPELAQIASERVPLLLLHSDFDLSFMIHGEPGPGARPAPGPYRMFDPARVTIGLPSDEPEPAVGAMRAALGARYDELVKVIGYPVRRAFTPPASPRELDEMRARLGVGEGRRIVLMMMGQDGMGDRLVDLAQQLLGSPLRGSPPLHVVAVCGRSERSRAAVERAAAGAAPHLQVRVTGLLDAAEIAAYMHLAAAPGDERGGVVVTKPGGATTAECATAGAYMLLTPGFSWEKGNEGFAVRHGLGEVIADGDLVATLERALRQPPSSPRRPVDWRRRVLTQLRRP